MASKRPGEVQTITADELQQVLRTDPYTRDERRIDRRVQMKLSVELRLSREKLRSIYTENISDGGLLFSIAPPVTLPGTVDLTLQLPDGETVHLTGDIRHVEKKHELLYVGVQFTSISEEVRQKFESALLTTN